MAKRKARPLPEREGKLIRRPCDNHRVDIALTVEDAAQAGLLLRWVAQSLRTVPELGLGTSGFLSFPQAAKQAERVADVLCAGIADALDPDGRTLLSDVEKVA